MFRRPKSYTITLKRAHNILKIPRDGDTINTSGGNVPSRDQIQEAFRAACFAHHPDVAKSVSAGTSGVASKLKNIADPSKTSANMTFRECHEARELLLDYYIRRKHIHPEIVKSKQDKPPEGYADETLFSVWKSNRSFQMEVFLRLSLCLGLAVGTYYHDLYMPERRKKQIQRRDAQYHQFGPQPRF